jgi:hypothetical protein
MAFVSDTFTDTNATTQPSHTGETGATWTQKLGSDPARIFSNILFPRQDTGTALQILYASGTPTNADYSVASAIRVDGSGDVDNEVGLVARLNTTTGECYFGRYSAADGAWEIWYTDGASTFTKLSHFDEAAPSADFTMTFVVTGTALALKSDATTKTSVTDATISAKGKAGTIYTSRSGGVTGCKLSYYDFTATDGAAALSANTASVTSFGSGSVVIAGTAASGGTDPKTYQLKRGTDGVTFGTNVGSAQVLSGSTAPSNVTDNGVTDGRLYYWKWNIPIPQPVLLIAISSIVSRTRPGRRFTSPRRAVIPTSEASLRRGRRSRGLTCILTFRSRPTTCWRSMAATRSAAICAPKMRQPQADTPSLSRNTGQARRRFRASNSYAVWLDECQYTTVSNLTITGSGVASNGTTTSTEAGVKATLAGSADINGLIVRTASSVGSGRGACGLLWPDR